MRLLVALLAAVLLSGCGTVTSALSSPAATIGCQVADVATTLRGLQLGAHEANPLMAGVLHALGPVGFVVVKIGVIVVLLETREKSPAVVAGANALSCGIAAHNLAIVR